MSPFDRALSRITRRQALVFQLAISVAAAAGILALMRGLWYPAPFFEVLGGQRLALVVIGVNLVLGPLLTVLMFRPGKWGLKFDVVVLAVIQVAALAYGIHLIAASRPAYVVLVKDQFEVVTAGELEPEQLARAPRPALRRPSWSGPEMVFSDAPREGEPRRKILASVLAGGPDVHQLPEYYAPLSERVAPALGYSHTLDHARKHWLAAAAAMERYLVESARAANDIRYLGGRARLGWFVCVLDAKSGSILAMEAIAGPDE